MKVIHIKILNYSFLIIGSCFLLLTARKYITTLNNFPDYVFEKDYTLMPLSELRTFINTNGHLPNMPKATEVAEEK